MKRPNLQIEAVGLALAAYSLWVLADTTLKIAGTTGLPAYEVNAVVGTAVVLLNVALAAGRDRFAALRPRSPGRQVLRASLELVNNLCVVVALRHLPLALFYILVFASPMVTTVLAAVFLHEPLGCRKALAVVAGFAGVVIAVDPFGRQAGDWIGYGACVLCVTSFSINVVLSRVMTRTETPESLTLVSGALGASFGAVCMLGNAGPVSMRLAGTLALTGLCGLVGSLCFFRALRQAPAATVSQYHYSQLLTGALLGYLIWRERPGLSMLLGAALIVGAGLYTATTADAGTGEAEALSPEGVA